MITASTLSYYMNFGNTRWLFLFDQSYINTDIADELG